MTPNRSNLTANFRSFWGHYAAMGYKANNTDRMTPNLRGLCGASLHKRGHLEGRGLLNKQMRLNDPRFAEK